MDDVIPEDSWEYRYFEVYWPLWGHEGVLATKDTLEEAQQHAEKFLLSRIERLPDMEDEEAAEWWEEDLKGRYIIITEHRTQELDGWGLEATRLVLKLGFNDSLEVVEV